MPPVSKAELEQEGSLKHSDCLCPICLEIFLEPVTLPCTHTFCKPCFLETVDKANICCPLCRKRVSTWARINGRNKTLVNVELWRRIQDAFPSQCQRRLNGIDTEEDMNMMVPKPRVSQPGELRQEYEDQISKFVEEKRALEEAERRASEEYIQRLLAEEEQRVAEERRRQEERQLEDDEKLARLLSEELNSSPVLESQKNIKVNDAASIKKKKPSVGHIEKYLCPVSCTQPQLETKPSSSLLANKENILNTPTFSPSPRERSSTEIPFWTYSGRPCTSNSEADASKTLSQTSNRTNISTKRKTIDNEQTVESELYKRPCPSPQPVTPLCEDVLLQEQAMREEDLMKRLLQEDEDRKLAQRLQRELDRESAVNRSKGSADGYLLRQKVSPSSTISTRPGEEDKGRKASPQSLTKKAGGLKVQKRVSGESTKLEGKTCKKSPGSVQETSFSTSLMQKGAKQTTLTEMFPNLGS